MFTNRHFVVVADSKKLGPIRSRNPLLAFVAFVLLINVSGAKAATLTVNSSADAGGSCPGSTCTLRQAILDAASGDTINFAAGLTAVDLTSAELLISKNLTISGPGASLLTIHRTAPYDDPPQFRIFDIASGNVTVVISGLSIANGNAGSQKLGGGVYNAGTLTINTTILSGNRADFGGAIYNASGAQAIIDNSTLSGNLISFAISGAGGGIYNGGTANITHSTLTGNDAAFGGGIHNVARLTVRDSTVSLNRGRSGGGGLFNDTTEIATIANCTISQNEGDPYGGGVYNQSGTVNAKNSIIAKNFALRGGFDFYGILTSQGHNLIGNNDRTTIVPMTGDQIGTVGSPIDPKLGPLQDNGGPTKTQSLLSGSPAIDQGYSSGWNTDQRGLARPVDAATIPNAADGDGSDIGAFEVQTGEFPSPTPTATPTSTPTSTPTPTPKPTPARSLNISTRARVQTGDNVLIGGFIVTGNVSKKVIVRALGPSLTKSGLTGVLADPMLELHGPDGSLILANDNWRDNPNQALLIQASGIPPEEERESAIVATLPPAGYTAIVNGKSNATGLGLVEVYDLDQSTDSKLANLSSRAMVETGNNVLIGGFILGGDSGSPQIFVRAIGPSLARLHIANPLPDPTLELRDGNGTLIAFDDNWNDNPAQASQIVAAGVRPQDDLESVIAISPSPGAYTAIVAGKNGGTGVGLVEIYNLQ